MLAAAGAYANNLLTEEQRFDVIRNACPGAGACGGMYTANTMASAIEAMGMSLPYSSSTPATDPLKLMECERAGKYVSHWSNPIRMPSLLHHWKTIGGAIDLAYKLPSSASAGPS